ncbi:MAG TPA: hypothetical protein VNK82_05870 [Terriglobales bacterium]|nr:hypothetical protein [Terriglobales bacterium]
MRELALAILLAFVCGSGPARAQSDTVSLLAGTRLRAKLESSVSTKTARVGDGVEVILLQPVERGSNVLVPTGSRLTGRVEDVRAADRKQRISARLRLAFYRMTFPDGRALEAPASLQSLGMSQDVDAEGVATQPGISKGETAGVVVTGAGVGAGIGAAAGGAKGAGIGAGIGGAIAVLGALAEASARWDDFELKKGRKLWLRLDQDVTLSEVSATQPSLPASHFEPAKPSASATEEPAPTSPQPHEGKADVATEAGSRIFLTDRKTWESLGGFERFRNTATSASSGTHLPKPEILKTLHERCPGFVVTVHAEKADYIVLLDHSHWGSPPYSVSVFTPAGDAIYSGGTQLLKNAIKDACAAIWAHK